MGPFRNYQTVSLGNMVNKKGKRVRGGCPRPSCPEDRPGSVLGARSFLALLLLFSSQEVVRDPPYGVRGFAYRTRDPAYCIPYRIRHSAYRSRRGCLEDDDFVVLHARYQILKISLI